MVSRMLSLENISVVKSAILISLSPELKREILCVPGSEYDVCKSSYQYYRKEQWNAIVERKAKEILKHRQLPENLEHKVLSILPAIALRMLIWAEYHEGSLAMDRYYSLDFLRFSHFTTLGLIDNKKAAEDMIKDANLSIKQKYKIACIYCFTHHISSFFKQIVGIQKDMFFSPEDSKWMEKPQIVKFWTSQLMGVIDDCNKYTAFSRYKLQTFIKSGSTEAVKYYRKKRGLHSLEQFHMYATTEVLKRKSEKGDWIVFSDWRYDDSKESWVPNDYSVDILCFLLSSMTESQQQEALKRNIQGNETNPNAQKHVTVLEYFLSWPYQYYFMKTAAILWNLMPQKTYAVILLKICDKIDPCKRNNLLYGEEKSYDYKKLLKDFWSQSPDHFKRYVFKNNLVIYENCVKVVTTTGIGLLLKLLSLNKFTYEDEEIIWLILGSATNEEKANLMSAEWWRGTCVKILKKEKFEIFDRLLLVFCKSEGKISEFKKKLNLYNASKTICRNFLKYGKISAIKSLISRISLPEKNLLALKNSIIYSDEGTERCQKLLSSCRYEDFEEFIKWFLPRDEEAIMYKKNLSRSYLGGDFPVHFVREKDLLDFVTRPTRSNTTNTEIITEIQTGVADIFGRSICEDLIMSSSVNVVYREEDSSVEVINVFRGGQWGRIDKFLTWCLSTTDKILEFKKTFFKEAGDNIHYKLIKAEQWGVAKRFYNWLQLSEAEIKNLKERAIYTHGTCWSMLHYLVFEHDDEMYNTETIDLLLRWHLTDKKTVIKFRDDFFRSHKDYDEEGLKKFNSLIENYLDDLNKEKIYQTCGNAEERFFKYLAGRGLKRKSTYFPQRKKICLSPTTEVIGETGNSNRRRSQRLLNKSLKK